MAHKSCANYTHGPKRPTIGSKETYYRVKRDLSHELHAWLTSLVTVEVTREMTHKQTEMTVR